MEDGNATFPKPELGEPYLLTLGPLATSIEVLPCCVTGVAGIKIWP